MPNTSNTDKLLHIEDGHLNTHHLPRTIYETDILCNKTVRNDGKHKRPLVCYIVETHDNLIRNIIT